MNLLLTESFDHSLTAHLTNKWHSQLGLYAPFSPAVVSTAAGRKGQGLALSTGALLYGSIPDTTDVVVGLAFRPVTLSNRRILSLRDEETIQVYLQLSATGFLQVFRGNGALLGSSAQSLQANKWCYIELRSLTSSTAGAITLRVNGNVLKGFSTTPVSTQVSSFARINILSLGDPTNNTAVFHYDDIMVNDGTLIGPQGVDVLRPNGGVPGYMSALVSNQSSNIGAGSAYQAINDLTPDGNISYVYVPLLGAGSAFFSEYEDIRDAVGAIAGIALHTYARKEYGNTRGFRPGVWPGTHDGAAGSLQYYGDPLYVETEYNYHSQYMTQNPGTGGTFTVGSINALKAGFLGWVS